MNLGQKVYCRCLVGAWSYQTTVLISSIWAGLSGTTLMPPCVKKFSQPDNTKKLFIQQHFLTKELVHASSICLTIEEEYQHQSKQARSRLPYEANNQCGGGVLEQRCCVWAYFQAYFPTSARTLGLYLHVCTSKGVGWSYTTVNSLIFCTDNIMQV